MELKILGRDNGLNVVEINGEPRRLTDAELADLRAVKPTDKAVKGPRAKAAKPTDEPRDDKPTYKAVKGPDES